MDHTKDFAKELLLGAGKERSTCIYLVRHGQSEGNARHIFLGHTDLDLTPLGYKQAELTAQELESAHVDAIYSSDLLRAYNTAAPHAKLHGLEIVGSEGLREIFCGDWEMTSGDWSEIHDEEKAKELPKPTNEEETCRYLWRTNYGISRTPNGETVQGAGERLYAEIKRIAEENVGKTVLIASHAAVIRAFWGKITGTKPEELARKFAFPANASYSMLIYANGEFLPVAYSCNEHLKVLGIDTWPARA